MFSIKIEINGGDNLTGLDALDERRRLGLSDGIYLNFCHDVSRIVEVDEGFARMYFNNTSVQESASVPICFLSKGDVTLGKYTSNQNDVCLSEDMSDERIKELFCRFVEKPIFNSSVVKNV